MWALICTASKFVYRGSMGDVAEIRRQDLLLGTTSHGQSSTVVTIKQAIRLWSLVTWAWCILWTIGVGTVEPTILSKCSLPPVVGVHVQCACRFCFLAL